MDAGFESFVWQDLIRLAWRSRISEHRDAQVAVGCVRDLSAVALWRQRAIVVEQLAEELVRDLQPEAVVFQARTNELGITGRRQHLTVVQSVRVAEPTLGAQRTLGLSSGQNLTLRMAVGIGSLLALPAAYVEWKPSPSWRLGAFVPAFFSLKLTLGSSLPATASTGASNRFQMQ